MKPESNFQLIEFRRLCGMVAYQRDNGLCMYCLHVRGRGARRGCEADHVFGRGNNYDMSREHWILRLTLCWDCHYQKHHGKDGWFDRDKEIQALIKANLHPEATNWNTFEVEQLIALNRPDMFRTFEVWRIAAQDALILHMPEEEFLILNN
jgi:hypothetical protein